MDIPMLLKKINHFKNNQCFSRDIFNNLIIKFNSVMGDASILHKSMVDWKTFAASCIFFYVVGTIMLNLIDLFIFIALATMCFFNSFFYCFYNFFYFFFFSNLFYNWLLSYFFYYYFFLFFFYVFFFIFNNFLFRRRGI